MCSDVGLVDCVSAVIGCLFQLGRQLNFPDDTSVPPPTTAKSAAKPGAAQAAKPSVAKPVKSSTAQAAKPGAAQAAKPGAAQAAKPGAVQSSKSTVPSKQREPRALSPDASVAIETSSRGRLRFSPLK